MILAAKRLRLHDDLVLAIHQRLSVVSLDHPMGGGHLRRFVVRDVALDLFPTFPDLGFFLLQELVQAFHLMQQSLLLLLLSFCLCVRQPILTDVFRDDLLEFRLQLVPLLFQFLERSAPFLGSIGRQLDTIQAEMRASQEIEFLADQQDVGKQAHDLRLYGRDKMSQGAVIWMTATTERHEEHILTTGALDLPRTDDPSGVRKQDDLE